MTSQPCARTWPRSARPGHRGDALALLDGHVGAEKFLEVRRERQEVEANGGLGGAWAAQIHGLLLERRHIHVVL